MSIIPASWEAEIRRITVWGHPKQKVLETPSQSASCRTTVSHNCDLRCTGGIGRKIMVQAGLDINTRTYLKSNWRAGSVAQLVERLSSKCAGPEFKSQAQVWYRWVHGSKKPTVRKTCACSGCIELSAWFISHTPRNDCGRHSHSTLYHSS
jgi:hypothetical protein